MFPAPWLVGVPRLLMLKVRRFVAWYPLRFVGQFGEKRMIRVFENAKAKNLLLFWARRCKGCDNDQRGGLLRDWQAAIGLI